MNKLKNFFFEYKSWQDYYKHNNLLFPESYVLRSFLSKYPVQFLKDYDFNKKKIIDIGCGNGRHSFFLKSLGFDVTGCEVSQELVNNLKKSFSKIKFKRALASKLPFKDNYFDYLLGANSVYYLEDSQTSIDDNLSELSRVVRPKGCLIISFVAQGHFILKDYIKEKNLSVIITQDPLKFRNGSRIRPLWDDEDVEKLFLRHDLFIHREAKISDTCNGFTRNLRYFSIYKK